GHQDDYRDDSRAQLSRHWRLSIGCARAPMVGSFTGSLDLARLDALEEPFRAEHQDHRHRDVDAEQFGGRPGMDGERAGDPDDQGADRGALDAAEAADDHDREGDDDHADREARLHRYHGRGQRPAQGGEEDAEQEGPGVDAGAIDPHAAGDLGVVDDGEDDLADARAVESPPHAETAQDRRQHQHEVVADIGQVADVDVAEQRVRFEDVIGGGAPHQLGHVLENEEQ